MSKGYFATNVGLRRQNNEDRFFADDDLELYIIADGMGGHADGEVAAQTAVDSFVSAIREGSTMYEASHRANSEVCLIGHGGMRSPGTTLTAIRFTGDVAEITHAGDSELYQWRNGEAARRLTRDHGGSYGLANFCGIGPSFFVDVFKIAVRRGDRFLLASDGLSAHFDPLRSTTIFGLMTSESLEQVTNRMIDLVLKRGANDNVTIIAIEV